MKKTLISLVCLIFCLLFIPSVRGIERTEETIYCTRGIHTPIIASLEIEKDEVITWDFTTYDSSFEAILGLWINTFTFVADLSFQKTSDRGEYRITQSGNYRFTIGNFGLNDGYARIVVENKQEISSYPLFITLALLGFVIMIKAKIITVKRKEKQGT